MSELLQAEGQDLQLFHDDCLGSGSYGKVCKAKLNELLCAAKLLHIIFFQFDDPRSQTIQRRFEQECELLKNLRHPNVVQYLGVTHDPQSGLPILLMELLDGNLTNFLEHSEEDLPYHLQVNLWHDIALALTYLHSKRIIHRDLSGNNVLLIAGSRAKVTDFGMSKLSVVYTSMSRLTQCPGTQLYMSPEALRTPPIYTDKLDVFSSGVVAIQIITRKYPDPGPDMLECYDPSSPTGISFTPIREVERRRNHIGLIDIKHPLLPVIQSCLNDREQDRPSARHICRQIVALKQAPRYAQSVQQPTPQERAILDTEKRIQEHQQVVQQLQTQIKKWEGYMQEPNTQLCENFTELQQKQKLLDTQSDLKLKTQELQEQSRGLQQALEGHVLHAYQSRIEELESKVKENEANDNLVKQLPPAFVARFTAEELPHHMKKFIEESLHEWEKNLYKVHLFSEHPSSGDLLKTKLDVHKNVTLEKVTERAYNILELGKCGVQLEQCQLVRYNEKSGTLGKPFDESKEMPFGEVVGGPQSCLSFDLFMEILIDPATLPPFEQDMRASRVIRANYSLLLQHLDANKLLPKLVDRSVISDATKIEVESYQYSWCQNAVIIDALLYTAHQSKGLLTISDTLQATIGKEYIAQHVLRDYWRMPAVGMLHSLETANTSLIPEVSNQFQILQQDVVDLLAQCPNVLRQLKQCLGSLVLPLGAGKVAFLFDQSLYEAARNVPEFFRIMDPYWNCLSTDLLSLLLDASGCKLAAVKLAEFEEARAISGPLIFCTHKASRGELRSVHSLPLEKLQSLHPTVFAESRAAIERTVTRITAEVSKPLLHVSCYEEVTTAICGFFQLPNTAITFAGCSENPLALCWLVSRNLLPYMTSHKGSLSGDRMLAEMQITQIAVGDLEFYKCPSLKEVELHEASFFGLLERIPALLTSVSIDAADTDERTALHIASQEGHDHVVELLLQAGANVDQEAKNESTPLLVASQEGHDKVVELLLQAGASTEQETEDGQTALYVASKNGYSKIVEALLNREADINHQTKFGQTPVRIARMQGHEHTVQLLLDASRQRMRTPLSELEDTSDSNDSSDLDVQEPSDIQKLLLDAVKRGNVEKVKENHKKGSKLTVADSKGWTPLHHAARLGKKEVVRYLAENIPRDALDLQEDELLQTALHKAAWYGYRGICKILVDSGASLLRKDYQGYTPYRNSTQNGDTELQQYLRRKEKEQRK